MITIKTVTCQGCNYTLIEAGVQLNLVGKYGAACNTASLDNQELHDYSTNCTTIFHSGSPDAGLGNFNNVFSYIFLSKVLIWIFSTILMLP